MNKNVSNVERELLEVRAAAALLGVSVRTLWRCRDMGVCPRPVQILGAVRWRRADLVEWIQEGCPNLSRARRTGKGGGR